MNLESSWLERLPFGWRHASRHDVQEKIAHLLKQAIPFVSEVSEVGQTDT